MATGWLNRAINIGGDNTALATSADIPQADLSKPESLSIGGNSVINIGKGNTGIARDGLLNSVVQVGDRNSGFAGGVLSNPGPDRQRQPRHRVPQR